MYINYYALPIFATVLILCALLYQIRKYKEENGTTCFSFFVASAIIYSFFYALEISTTNFETALTFYKLEYIAIPFMACLFMTFAIKYTGKKRWFNVPTLSAILTIPIITLVLVFFTGEHTLFHKEIYMNYNSVFPALSFEPGIWYYIQQAYNMFCILFGEVLLLSMWLEITPTFRKKLSLVMIGAMIPFTILLLYLCNTFPEGIDIMPYGLALFGLLSYIGLTRYKLLDITPLARSTLFGKLPEGVIVIDEMKRIADCNTSAAEYLGINPSDIGKNAAEVLDLWPEITSGKYQTIEDGTKSVEIKRNIQGTDIWFNLEFLQLAIENEKSMGQMIILRDITESKKAEEKLLEANRILAQANARAEYMASQAEMANRAKSEFLANISHELRTPISGIIGFSDVLMETELTESQLHYTKTVYKSANALLEMINDLIDYSRIETGKLDLALEKIELGHIINRIAENTRTNANQKGLDFKLDISENLPEYAIADPHRLKQVMANLLSNAIKFTEKGEVELKVETFFVPEKANEVKLRFSVSDTGIGISEENKLKIFDSFSQADGSLTRRYGGTGLGLTISSRLLELMDSKLEFESEPGKGSIFYFTLTLPVETTDIKAKKERKEKKREQEILV